MMPSYTTPEYCDDADGDDEEDEEKNDDDDDDKFIGLLRFSRGLYIKAFPLVPPNKISHIHVYL
jgi:hypothetical protein